TTTDNTLAMVVVNHTVFVTESIYWGKANIWYSVILTHCSDRVFGLPCRNWPIQIKMNNGSPCEQHLQVILVVNQLLHTLYLIHWHRTSMRIVWFILASLGDDTWGLLQVFLSKAIRPPL